MTVPWRPTRTALRFAVALCVLVVSTGAPGGEADLEHGEALVEAGRLAEARTFYDSVLRDSGRKPKERDEARYRLARLGEAEALAAAGRVGATYDEIRRGFETASTAIEAFVKQNPKSDHAGQARLDVGTTRLAFVRWARALLDDPERLAKRGFDSGRLSDDARSMVDQAIRYFGALRPGAYARSPRPYQALAAYYHVLSQYYRALVEAPCSPAQISALEKAGNDLEDYIMHHDGSLLALYAQDLYGLVWWELARCTEDKEKKFDCYARAFEWFEACIYSEVDSPDHLPAVLAGYHHTAQAGLEAGRLSVRSYKQRNFAREALGQLETLLDRHPTAGTTDHGLKALIAWSRLECRRGNGPAAVRVAHDAARRAAESGKARLEHLANRQLDEYVSGGCGGRPPGVLDPDVLCRAARHRFSAQAYRAAIHAYHRVVRATSDSPEEFLAWRWNTWRRMAEAYAALGEPLGEALAYEAIHDAWMAGRIPRATGPEGDARLREVCADRRACVAALQRAAEATGSAAVRARFEAARDGLAVEYPDCPAPEEAGAAAPPEGPFAGPECAALAEAGHPDLDDVRSWEAARGPRDLGGGGGGRRTQAAVEDALKWLAAHQSPNGGWEAAGFQKWCDGKPAAQGPDGQGQALFDPGVTGLALSAFLGAGYTGRGRHPFATTVAKGLRYLKNVQDVEGCYGPRTCQRYVYNHAAAALAMVEAFRRTRSAIYKRSAQKALDFIAVCRNPYFVWRYGVKPGDNDTSVTGWMMLALKSAKLANEEAVKRGRPAPLVIDEEAFDGIKAWIEKMTDQDYGRTGYIERGGAPCRYEGHGEGFPRDRSESTTAVGMLARIFIGEDPRRSKMIKKGADLCAREPPSWNPSGGSIDIVYWYYATLAMFQVGGPHWKTWNQGLKTAVVGSQRKDTTYCLYKGSWNPIDPWGKFGGRVYSTALLAACLQVYYRYDKVFGTKR